MKRWARLVVAAVSVSGAIGRAAPSNLAPPTDYVQSGQLPPAEAQAALDQFRRSGPAQPAYLEFELRHLPRRGPATTSKGRLWISRNQEGSVVRIELEGATHFLIQNGPHAQVWRWTLGRTSTVAAAEPLQAGLEITPFDLQMPFLYWPQKTGVTLSRIRGRPADVFLFAAPATAAPLTAVRAYLDSEYHAPVQIESLGGENVLKTYSLLDLKNVSSQWIPKDIEVQDAFERDRSGPGARSPVDGVRSGEPRRKPRGSDDRAALVTGGARPPPFAKASGDRPDATGLRYFFFLPDALAGRFSSARRRSSPTLARLTRANFFKVARCLALIRTEI